MRTEFSGCFKNIPSYPQFTRSIRKALPYIDLVLAVFTKINAKKYHGPLDEFLTSFCQRDFPFFTRLFQGLNFGIGSYKKTYVSSCKLLVGCFLINMRIL